MSPYGRKSGEIRENLQLHFTRGGEDGFNEPDYKMRSFSCLSAMRGLFKGVTI